MSAVYPSALQAFGRGELNWEADPFRALLVAQEGYTYSAAHRVLADIPPAARVALSAPLERKEMLAGGVADARDTLFESVIGPAVNAVVLFRDRDGEQGALIAYIDEMDGLSEWPLEPRGADVLIAWPDDDGRIFRL